MGPFFGGGRQYQTWCKSMGAFFGEFPLYQCGVWLGNDTCWGEPRWTTKMISQASGKYQPHQVSYEVLRWYKIDPIVCIMMMLTWMKWCALQTEINLKGQNWWLYLRKFEWRWFDECITWWSWLIWWIDLVSHVWGYLMLARCVVRICVSRWLGIHIRMHQIYTTIQPFVRIAGEAQCFIFLNSPLSVGYNAFVSWDCLDKMMFQKP